MFFTTDLQKLQHNLFQRWGCLFPVPALQVLHNTPVAGSSAVPTSLYDQLLQSGSEIGKG